MSSSFKVPISHPSGCQTLVEPEPPQICKIQTDRWTNRARECTARAPEYPKSEQMAPAPACPVTLTALTTQDRVRAVSHSHHKGRGSSRPIARVLLPPPNPDLHSRS